MEGLTKKDILFIAFCFETVLIALDHQHLSKHIREMAQELIKGKEKENEEDNV